TADHHGVAAGLCHHGGVVHGGADVAVADHRNADGRLDGGDPVPLRLACISLLAGARVHGDTLQSAVLGHAREVEEDQFLVVPSGAELYREGDAHGCAHALEDAANQRQIAQQAGAAVALHYFLGGAAEV